MNSEKGFKVSQSTLEYDSSEYGLCFASLPHSRKLFLHSLTVFKCHQGFIRLSSGVLHNTGAIVVRLSPPGSLSSRRPLETGKLTRRVS